MENNTELDRLIVLNEELPANSSKENKDIQRADKINLLTLHDQLKRHEGFRSTPYLCPKGVWTIGYGFTYLEEDEADLVLDLKIKKLVWALSNNIRELSPVRQSVLLNMAYNLGIPKLMKFVKMWKAIKKEDWDEAANEMLDSDWADDVKGRAIELSELMRNG